MGRLRVRYKEVHRPLATRCMPWKDSMPCAGNGHNAPQAARACHQGASAPEVG